jgi:hypothetical protein
VLHGCCGTEGIRTASWLVEQVPPEAVVTLGLDGLRAAVARCARGGLSI